MLSYSIKITTNNYINYLYIDTPPRWHFTDSTYCCFGANTVNYNNAWIYLGCNDQSNCANVPVAMYAKHEESGQYVSTGFEASSAFGITNRNMDYPAWISWDNYRVVLTDQWGWAEF